MKLIVGLGNPGERYENTRHNMGFLVVDDLLKKFEPLKRTFWEEDKEQTLDRRQKGKALTKKLVIEDQEVMIAKPETFMNESGVAVSYLLNYYKIDPQDLIVIYDDLDLPIGRTRVRFGGAAGGHRGVESILASIGTDKFLRVRLGIGRPTHMSEDMKKGKSVMAVEDYVLAPVSSSEKSTVKHMVKETVKSIELLLKHGIDTYMSKYNNK